MRKPSCHPERTYQARDMCNPCYQSWHSKNMRKPRARKDPSEFAENYRRPPTKVARIPECGHPDEKHVALGMCRACYQKDRPGRPRAECHPERPLVAKGKCGMCLSRTRYHDSPEEHQARARENGAKYRKQLREQLLAAYGGKCACDRCPEANPAFLTLEHVGGGGRKHREKVGSHSYADLRRQGFPQDGYTLLCWNCNAGSRFTGVCPHMIDEHQTGE